MAKGYWIVQVTVTDPDRYAQYLASDKEVLARYGAKPIMRGGRTEAPEGEAHGRQIVLEFESFEKAVECYHSPEYQAAKEHRLASSKSDIVIVEGAD
jgi:uncharacterized protein (DUF1330 family)